MNKDFNKILSLLERGQIKSLVILFVLLLVGMLFEILGIGMLLPILTAITSPDRLMEFQIIKSLLTSLNINSTEQFVNLSLIFLVTLYTIKSIFLLS